MVPETEPRPVPTRILVVEDEVLIRIVLAEELREAGFSVVEAANAEEALAWLSAGGGVDAIFSDIRMPGSLNGLDLSRLVRERYPGLPIILTSGDFAGTYGAHAVDGPSSFIPKPYRTEQVISLINKILALKRPDGSR